MLYVRGRVPKSLHSLAARSSVENLSPFSVDLAAYRRVNFRIYTDDRYIYIYLDRSSRETSDKITRWRYRSWIASISFFFLSFFLFFRETFLAVRGRRYLNEKGTIERRASVPKMRG